MAPLTKDPRVYLVQILERVGWILGYTAKGSEAFFNETLIQDGVIRNLEVIGEAANEFRMIFENPILKFLGKALPRCVMCSFISTKGVSLPEVWNVVEVELPILKSALEAMLPPTDELEREIAGDSEGRVSS